VCAGDGDVQEDEAALRERVRNARMFKKLRSLKLVRSQGFPPFHSDHAHFTYTGCLSLTHRDPLLQMLFVHVVHWRCDYATADRPRLACCKSVFCMAWTSSTGVVFMVSDNCMFVQEVDVVSDNNAFLQPYGVPQVVREILKLSNIVIAPELVMLPQPYRSPGTYQVPLAVLDEAGEQVSVSLQLVPRQASAEQLKTDTAS
jgi:hypothetical protein